jgi:quercetin dioxygenase-like cupin family protein
MMDQQHWYDTMEPELPPEDVPYVPREVISIDLQKESLDNSYYRKALVTTHNMQIVVQYIPKGNTVKREAHKDSDQFIRVERGLLRIVTIGKGAPNKQVVLTPGMSAIVPHGTWHTLIALEDTDISNIYAPPQDQVNALELVAE